MELYSWRGRYSQPISFPQKSFKGEPLVSRTTSENPMDAFIQQIEEVPYYRYLGIRIRHYGRGEATARMENNRINGPFGVIDEGPLLTLGSLTTQIATLTLVGQGRSVIPLEQRLSMLRPTKSTKFLARAKIDHLRARIAQGRFRIFDEEGEMIGSGGLIAYVLPRTQVGQWKLQPFPPPDTDFDASSTDLDSEIPITFQYTNEHYKEDE